MPQCSIAAGAVADPAPSAAGEPVPVSLALQGGGAHGAFTWGVLDALLADGRLGFQAISGASAGALNAVALAGGWLAGGPAGARAALDRLWGSIAAHQVAWPLRNTLLERALFGHDLTYSAAWQGFARIIRHASPYQLNPFDWNPLREVIRSALDVERVRRESRHRLFVAATDVATGKARLFTEAELSAEVLVASACLPFLFQAPRIGGRRYWDGGYAGNPPLWPLYEDCGAGDILLVEVNPIHRPELPTAAPDILNRINEISMTTALRGEMRAIAFAERLLRAGDAGAGPDAAPRRPPRLHAIHDDRAMAAFNLSTKFNADPGFLRELKAVGQAAAERWLAAHLTDVGVRSSVDVADRYL